MPTTVLNNYVSKSIEKQTSQNFHKIIFFKHVTIWDYSHRIVTKICQNRDLSTRKTTFLGPETQKPTNKYQKIENRESIENIEKYIIKKILSIKKRSYSKI